MAVSTETTLVIVRVLELISLVLGLTIAYLAYRAHKRDKSNPLLFLSLGFIALAAGSIAEGTLFEVMGTSLLEADGARALLTILGFLLVLFSIKLM